MMAAQEPRGDGTEALNHLLGYRIELRNGSSKTVRELIADIVGSTTGKTDGRQSRRALGRVGLKLIQSAGKTPWLAVANNNRGLARIFAGTPWAAHVQVTARWRAALIGLPGADIPKKAFCFDGDIQRATALPLDYVLDITDSGGTDRARNAVQK